VVVSVGGLRTLLVTHLYCLPDLIFQHHRNASYRRDTT
jgi:hypothetical protein